MQSDQLDIKEYTIVIVYGRLALECQSTLRVGPKVGTTVPKFWQCCDVFRQLASNDSQATSDKMSTETHEANTMQRRNLHEFSQQHQRKHICRVTKILSFFLPTVALYSVSVKHYHTFRGCMHVPTTQTTTMNDILQGSIITMLKQSEKLWFIDEKWLTSLTTPSPPPSTSCAYQKLSRMSRLLDLDHQWWHRRLRWMTFCKDRELQS